MFLRKAALRPVPRWATVDEIAIDGVEQALGEGEDALQEALDHGYRLMDRTQPTLAEWLAERVADREDALVQSVGYFLTVTVFLAFQEAFPTRMNRVTEDALSLAAMTLSADEELRDSDPLEALDSDDVVALSQPAVVAYVQHHLEQALEQADEESDFEGFDQVYRTTLIEVIALSHAVAAPHGQARPATYA